MSKAGTRQGHSDAKTLALQSMPSPTATPSPLGRMSQSHGTSPPASPYYSTTWTTSELLRRLASGNTSWTQRAFISQDAAITLEFGFVTVVTMCPETATELGCGEMVECCCSIKHVHLRRSPTDNWELVGISHEDCEDLTLLSEDCIPPVINTHTTTTLTHSQSAPVPHAALPVIWQWAHAASLQHHATTTTTTTTAESDTDEFTTDDDILWPSPTYFPTTNNPSIILPPSRPTPAPTQPHTLSSHSAPQIPHLPSLPTTTQPPRPHPHPPHLQDDGITPRSHSEGMVLRTPRDSGIASRTPSGTQRAAQWLAQKARRLTSPWHSPLKPEGNDPAMAGGSNGAHAATGGVSPLQLLLGNLVTSA